jgi:broad specificity phosphatase PhoE
MNRETAGVTRLIFVRHAESMANTIGSLDCAVPGPPLSPLGFEQAKQLPDELVADIDGTGVHAVWASTMLRAQQTAEPVAERWGMPLRVHPALHEGHVGDLHGRVDEEAHQALEDLLVRWLLDGDLAHCRLSGETGDSLVDRMRRVLGDVLAPGPDSGTVRPGVAVVVSHGAMLRVALPQLCQGLSPAFTLAHHLPNTGRVIVDVLDRNGPALSCRSWAGLTPH